ncbi:hypothetical protein B0A52_08777 [Exophiala mesophila]|uniref:Mediator of RNA polymerase II transcription subunit 8 n=1 Tax=Exophiala mesophila TaxID=212818 RepID=A0A438MUK2_EXOME|nr:hypothetical protein B0A52_08777 [Exophiala mesophila]
MSVLDQDQIRALDKTRQLLLSLHTALVALRSEVSQNPGLPSWPALQAHANLLSSNLQTITDQLSTHSESFSSTLVNPLPQFPGKERSFILETLLRTKLEPSTQDWISDGQDIASRQQKQGHVGLAEAERDRLWQWGPHSANMIARGQKWGADYTLEEVRKGIDSVRTGLHRELIEPQDEAEDEDGQGDEDEEDEITDDEAEQNPTENDDKMDTRPSNESTSGAPDKFNLAATSMMPMTSLHRFMSTGR